MARRTSPHKGAPAAPLNPPGASTGFLHGDFAAATINNGSGAATFNMFEWRVESTTRTVNSRAHGELWDRAVPISSAWRFTGRGYITAASAAHAMNAGFANDTTEPPAIAVIGYSGSTSGTAIFTGSGVMTRATIDAPDGAMAIQEIEVEGFGVPTVGV